MREMTAWCVIFVLVLLVLSLLGEMTFFGALGAFVAATIWAVVMWSVEPEHELSCYRGDKNP